ncbi:MAG: response regulator transcription factor [Leptospiraceae bacterium]|nr:response regulator transcription factor [Leptospiraceae bacterium]
MSTEKIKVFIVDDHPVVIAGLASIINADPRFEVTGSAETINSSVEQIRDKNIHLVIIDISLKKNESGLDLVKTLKNESNPPLMLVMSRYEENIYAERALKAGARGYLMKDEAGEKIISAIETILAGKLYLKEELASQILNKIFVMGVDEAEDTVSLLTSRELQVYEMIGRGLSTREIAEKLLLSVSTIETHSQNIKEKLGLKNARELTKNAVQWVLSSQNN